MKKILGKEEKVFFHLPSFNNKFDNLKNMIMTRLFNFSLAKPLLFCMLCLLTFTLTSCGDNDSGSKKQVDESEIFVPDAKDRQAFNVANLLGKLSYDEDTKEWIILPEREQDNMFIHLGDEEGAYMIVSNMKKEYEDYVGTITFSGKTAMKHQIISNSKMRNKTYVYTIELSDIIPTEESHK
ncbi:hypothetical protein [Bacteroides intestinalis]|uniref:hypothetical protein n=1 Tax=Bacteroides intestinalis TaxID=329854 RepID=UPI00189E6385|nr:hypothetical protein [Bacteroides intestinalis]